MKNQTVRMISLNGIIAALYLALTIVVAPFSSGAIQFRISESLNHLIIFDKRLKWGITAGVILYNLLYSNILDVLFGGLQTFIALSLTAYFSKYFPEIWQKMVLNIVFFSVSMCLIAWMLFITLKLPFWGTYFTTALSEAIIMTLSAPVMYYIGNIVKMKLN